MFPYFRTYSSYIARISDCSKRYSSGSSVWSTSAESFNFLEDVGEVVTEAGSIAADPGACCSSCATWSVRFARRNISNAMLGLKENDHFTAILRQQGFL